MFHTVTTEVQTSTNIEAEEVNPTALTDNPEATMHQTTDIHKDTTEEAQIAPGSLTTTAETLQAQIHLKTETTNSDIETTKEVVSFQIGITTKKTQTPNTWRLGVFVLNVRKGTELILSAQ